MAEEARKMAVEYIPLVVSFFFSALGDAVQIHHCTSTSSIGQPLTLSISRPVHINPWNLQRIATPIHFGRQGNASTVLRKFISTSSRSLYCLQSSLTAASWKGGTFSRV